MRTKLESKPHIHHRLSVDYPFLCGCEKNIVFSSHGVAAGVEHQEICRSSARWKVIANELEYLRQSMLFRITTRGVFDAKFPLRWESFDLSNLNDDAPDVVYLGSIDVDLCAKMS